ncbi:MAG: hypothetical protein Q9180_009878, partial [Flavoplaca navasiana]
MELREMLMGSNEEVQKLRQLMMDHQEVPSNDHPDVSKPTLGADLERSTPAEPDSVPALHVHHHYHEASKAVVPPRQRSIKARKPRKRRVDSGPSTPRSGFETPWTPTRRTLAPSSVTTILSQTAVSIPPPQYSLPHGLSTHSSNTRSSVAPSELNSPHPSMFDFLSDSSRPTSPDSVNVISPRLLAQSNKDQFAPSQRRPSTKVAASPNPMYSRRPPGSSHINHNGKDNSTAQKTILEGAEDAFDLEKLLAEAASPNDDIYAPNPGLRRCASHESILSVA